MKSVITLGFVLFVALTWSSFADDTKYAEKNMKMPTAKMSENMNAHMGRMKSMTADQRKNMADLHEKMAVCLRSDKALDECHTEMMTACKDLMGAESCPMMGGMMDHHGMMKANKKKKY